MKISKKGYINLSEEEKDSNILKISVVFRKLETINLIF